MSLASIANPFHSSVVSDPWDAPETDVISVHQAAFNRCCEAVAAIRTRPHTTSALIYGQAGSGKTHLLARLRARVAREAEADGPGGMQEAIFVSAPLRTSARMIWRHLRDCLVGDLLRHSGAGATQLERLLLNLLTKHGMIDGDSRLWLAEKSREARIENHRLFELEELFDLIDGEGRLSYSLRAALGHLLVGRHRGLAVAWLRGASLPETALAKLEIMPAPDDDDELEEQAHQLVIALCSLATAELPLIFCFDQIEALQLDPKDPSGLIAFGQMISALQAETRHTLLITCVQAVFRDALGQHVRGADLDRIKEFGEVALNPLTWEEAKQLIKARMDAAPELKRLRADQSEPLWPLSETNIRADINGDDYVARRLIARCAALFEQRRDGSIVAMREAPALENFLNQGLEERQSKALESSEPSQTNQIITHGLPALLTLTDSGWRQMNQNVPAGVDMLFESPTESVAIGLCNNRPGPGLIKKLNQLRDLAENSPATRLILMRDSRLPKIGTTAVKTRESREQLLRKGARWVEPNADALAALDALRRLLSDAKSGELELRGDTVEFESVQDWLRRNLTVELKDFLGDVLPGEVMPAPEDLYDEIDELLGRQHLVSVTDVAALLGKDSCEVEACAQRHSERIGVLGDPPSVLFRLVT